MKRPIVIKNAWLLLFQNHVYFVNIACKSITGNNVCSNVYTE